MTRSTLTLVIERHVTLPGEPDVFTLDVEGAYDQRAIHPASLLSALSSLDLAVRGTSLHCWMTGEPLGAIRRDPPAPVPAVAEPVPPWGSAVTLLELATFRLGRPASSGADFDEASLPIIGGCAVCGATVAAYNACPSRNGYIKCAGGCIGDDGYMTVREASDALFPAEPHPGPGEPNMGTASDD